MFRDLERQSKIYISKLPKKYQDKVVSIQKIIGVNDTPLYELNLKDEWCLDDEYGSHMYYFSSFKDLVSALKWELTIDKEYLQYECN